MAVKRTTGVAFWHVLALLASGLHRMAAGDIKMFGNFSDERNTYVRTNEKAG